MSMFIKIAILSNATSTFFDKWWLWRCLFCFLICIRNCYDNYPHLCWLKTNIGDGVAHLMFEFACFDQVFKLLYTCSKLLHIYHSYWWFFQQFLRRSIFTCLWSKFQVHSSCYQWHALFNHFMVYPRWIHFKWLNFLSITILKIMLMF